MVNASFSCMREMSIYVDGKKMMGNVSCTQSRPQAVNFAIPRNTQVVAIKAENTAKERPSIIGSFNDGVVTDANWKCTSNKYGKWERSDFDDAPWSDAVEISGNSGDGGTGTDLIIGTLTQAKWIRTAGVKNRTMMYCRLLRDRSRP